MKFFTYILECSDKTLYTGFTNNLEKRIETHNAKKWAKYTRGRTPVSLKYFEIFETKKEARKREHEIKQLSKQEKLSLIENINTSFSKN